MQYFCATPQGKDGCADPGTSMGAMTAAQAASDAGWISLASAEDGPYTTVTLRSQPESEHHVGQALPADGHEIPLVQARYVRLKIDQSCNDGSTSATANIARIYEFRVMTSIGVRCCADSEKMCSDLTCDDTLEAEAATLGSVTATGQLNCDPSGAPSGPTLVTRGNLNGATGTGYVQFNTPQDTITWVLDSCTVGLHDLSFRYALAATGGTASVNGNRNEMSVSVTEGTVSGSTTMHLHSTGGWEYWGTTTVGVRLVAGTNTVVLGVAPGDTGGGELPNVDWMTVALNTDSAGLGNVCDALEGFKYTPHAADMTNPSSTGMSDVRH